MLMRTGVVLRVEYALGLSMAVVLFFMMLLGAADVIFRYLLNSPIAGSTELAALALGVLVFGSLPLVTARGEHVTVDLLAPDLERFAGRLRYAATGLISALVVGVMAWRIGLLALDFADYGDSSSFLNIPLAPLAWVMCAASALSAFILLFQGASALLGKPKAVV